MISPWKAGEENTKQRSITVSPPCEPSSFQLMALSSEGLFAPVPACNLCVVPNPVLPITLQAKMSLGLPPSQLQSPECFWSKLGFRWPFSLSDPLPSTRSCGHLCLNVSQTCRIGCVEGKRCFLWRWLQTLQGYASPGKETDETERPTKSFKTDDSGLILPLFS